MIPDVVTDTQEGVTATNIDAAVQAVREVMSHVAADVCSASYLNDERRRSRFTAEVRGQNGDVSPPPHKDTVLILSPSFL